MPTVETIQSVYVKLDNRPGALEDVARALGTQKINIDALSLETVGSTGFVRLFAHKTKEAVRALQNAGLDATPSDALLVTLPNRAGELSRATAEIAAAGINLESILTTPDGRLALRTSDNERAAQILRKL